MATKMKFRAQYDGKEDEISDASGLDTGTDTLTRQEFKDEADINVILNRFGVAQVRPLRYGDEIDYSIDLQDAMHALSAVEGLPAIVPEELQGKYPDWRSILNATESGQYQKDLGDLAAKKKLDLELEREKEAAAAKPPAAEETPKPASKPV